MAWTKQQQKATSLHQQRQDLNFFLYLSEFSKEHQFAQTGSHSWDLQTIKTKL